VGDEAIPHTVAQQETAKCLKLKRGLQVLFDIRMMPIHFPSEENKSTVNQ